MSAGLTNAINGNNLSAGHHHDLAISDWWGPDKDTHNLNPSILLFFHIPTVAPLFPTEIDPLLIAGLF